MDRSIWAGLAVGLMTTPATASLPPDVVIWFAKAMFSADLPPAVAGWFAAWLGSVLSVISGVATAHLTPDRQWSPEERAAKLGQG